MKRASNMGGGEFEFKPNEFEAKINKRKLFIDNDFKYIKEFLAKRADEYQATYKLGDGNNYKESILQKLIKDFRELK